MCQLLSGPSRWRFKTFSRNQKAKIRRLISFRCSSHIKTFLTAPVTAEHMKYKVFALPRNKTPGPDGFTAEFIRRSWTVIGGDVVRAIQKFFLNGKMLRQWNATAISSTPKYVGADKVTEFRPVSCCNVSYKVISKILARKLHAVLPNMISNTQ